MITVASHLPADCATALSHLPGLDAQAHTDDLLIQNRPYLRLSTTFHAQTPDIQSPITVSGV